MPSILRVPADPGYLSNKRMALEIAIGLADLSGRTLSLPLDEPIGWGPRPARPEHESGPASSLRDLYEVPVPVVEGPGPTDRPPVRIEGDDLTDAVFVDPPDLVDRADFEAFVRDQVTEYREMSREIGLIQ